MRETKEEARENLHSLHSLHSPPGNSPLAGLLAVARPALWRALVFGWWIGRTVGECERPHGSGSAHSGPGGL